MKAILGKKILMTRIFDKTGLQMPVTLVKIVNNIITQIKTKEKDGYAAIQVGASTKKRLTKTEEGHLKKANTDIKPRFYYEIKTNKQFRVGQELNTEQFQAGEKINVTGVSKGKGFSGTVKRHHFHLGPKTHGSDSYRRPGSIGSTYPERVIKGRRMASRMGGEKKTIKNLEIIKVNNQSQEMLIKGAIPGPKSASVLIWGQNES